MTDKDLVQLITASGFGIFCHYAGKDTFLGEADGLQFDRKVKTVNGNLVLQLHLHNTLPEQIKIYAFVVCDFVISDKVSEVLEHNWLQCGRVVWKPLFKPTHQNKLFLVRDSNPYSFRDEYGYIADSVVSEWFTCLNIKSKSLVVGAVTTKDQFAQVFVKDLGGSVQVRVTSQFDGLEVASGKKVSSEAFFVGLGERSAKLTQYAKLTAKYMGVNEVAQPIKAICLSYYSQGNYITQASVDRELDVLHGLGDKLRLDVVQLDAGYTKFFGDWFEYKERFPSGLEGFVKKVKSLKAEPGIWLSPFSINPNVTLHEEHRRWLLRGVHNSHFSGRLTTPFDEATPLINLEILDPTKTEVKNYLEEVLTHFLKLGFKFFKLDFMYPVCLAPKFSKKVTRVQALREGLEFIKDVVGEATLLSAITQLSPVIGIFDHVRVGIDTLNPFVRAVPGIKTVVNDVMLEQNLSDAKARLPFNGILWRGDPDALVFDESMGVSHSLLTEQRKLVLGNKLSRWIGDSLWRLTDNEMADLVATLNTQWANN